jgi:simple sugar transport system permease protein
MNQRIAAGGGLTRALLSILAGLLLAALLIRASGYDVLDACSALWSGATGLQAGPAKTPNQVPFGIGSWRACLDTFVLAQSLARVTPLLLAGLAVGLGLRAGLFNIGAQGQMVLGALAAAVVGGMRSPSALVHVPLALLAGALWGALWGALPGLLRARRGVHEVISTIMLNYLAVNFASYLVTHGLKDPKSMSVQTPLIRQTAWLSPFVPGSNLTAGFLIALLAAFALSFLMRRTALGYQIRAVGLNAEAAGASGVPVSRILVVTMALSGALAGLAGAMEVLGVHHRFVQGVAGNYGFDGIAVALLGGLTGGGIALSALFFGALANGAAFMQLQTEVPDSIAVIVQAAVILCVGIRPMRRAVPRTPRPAAADADEWQEESDASR